jgi:hypothetical protein
MDQFLTVDSQITQISSSSLNKTSCSFAHSKTDSIINNKLKMMDQQIQSTNNLLPGTNVIE